MALVAINMWDSNEFSCGPAGLRSDISLQKVDSLLVLVAVREAKKAPPKRNLRD